MAYLKLLREKPEGKAVRGKLYLATFEHNEEQLELLCSTLENWDFIIPPLIYRLTVTYSPKFKRPLPLVNGVPKSLPLPQLGHSRGSAEQIVELARKKGNEGKGLVSALRTGIRFHPGSKPEHSKGCILVSRKAEERLKALILSEKETMIEINNPQTANCYV